MRTDTALITGTDFVAISTKDVDAAEKFYSETLGLPILKRWGNLPAVEFETGNLTLAVMQSDAFGREHAATQFPIEFHVDDFDAAKSELESRGVEFQPMGDGDVIDSGVCKQAFFQDPDGNSLAIHHRYADGTPPMAQ